MTTTRTKPLSSQFYMPKPREWEWEKLDLIEITQRLTMARDSAESLERLEQDLRKRVHEEKLQMWARSPVAKYQEVLEFNRKVNDYDKQIAAVRRLRAKVADAIGYIERRMTDGDRSPRPQELGFSQPH